MKMWIALALVAFAAVASAQCPCDTMKWATCDGTPCTCTLLVGENVKQTLKCEALIPKCFLMKAEMYRAKKGLSTRTIGGKPVETAFVDNDGIYDPDCETDGKFRAKQCNNTEECWCVNSAGVRRTDKEGKDLACPKLVETMWVRLQLKHKPLTTPINAANLKAAISDAMNKRYKGFNKALVEAVEYDADSRRIVVDVKKAKGERATDLSRMAYYMEKDVKVLPLFKDQETFAPVVDGQKVELEDILVYYVDEEAPTFTMKHLSGGIIAVIVVVVLAVVAGLLVLVSAFIQMSGVIIAVIVVVVVLAAVVAGLLVLFFARRRANQRYSKTQQRELDPM